MKIADNLLAVFTFFLVVVGIGQGWALLRTVNLARDEFSATHRPQLIVHEIAWTHLIDGRDAVAFTLANNGGNSCTVIESAFEVRSTSGDGIFVRTQALNEIGPITLAAGEFRPLAHIIESEEEGFIAGGRGMLLEHFFRGTILYEDSATIRRRLAFTRSCIGPSNRFLPTGDASDECTD